jgi:hypothetical protein
VRLQGGGILIPAGLSAAPSSRHALRIGARRSVRGLKTSLSAPFARNRATFSLSTLENVAGFIAIRALGDVFAALGLGGCPGAEGRTCFDR